MGEARRKRIAGYVPESRPEPTSRKMVSIGHVDSGRLGRLALIAMLSSNPSIPQQLVTRGTQEGKE